MTLKIKQADKTKFSKKLQKYVDGKGNILPKWLQPPTVDESFLINNNGVVFDADTCDKLYPFRAGTPDAVKFRVLLSLRFASLLGGLDEDGVDIKYINEWLRQLLISSDTLRKACGISEWSLLQPPNENNTNEKESNN